MRTDGQTRESEPVGIVGDFAYTTCSWIGDRTLSLHNNTIEGQHAFDSRANGGRYTISISPETER